MEIADKETGADQDVVTLALACRMYAYNLLHMVFGLAPQEKTIETALNDRSIDVIGLLLAREGTENGVITAEARTALDRLGVLRAEPSREVLSRAARAYTELFQVPGELYTYPWESPYTGTGATMFQESTLDVRAFYHRAGFRLDAESRFPDDHIAAMMDFMRRLTERAYHAYLQGDEAAFREALTMQESFIREHIVTWMPQFAGKVEENDSSGFYGAFAAVLALLVGSDALTITRLTEAM